MTLLLFSESSSFLAYFLYVSLTANAVAEAASLTVTLIFSTVGP